MLYNANELILPVRIDNQQEVTINIGLVTPVTEMQHSADQPMQVFVAAVSHKMQKLAAKQAYNQ